MATNHICGLFYVDSSAAGSWNRPRTYLPQLSLSCHTRMLSSVVTTSMKQTFINTSSNVIPKLCYTFPLYDGVSVVGFTCAVKERIIRGVVREKHAARKTYDEAAARGETAGLLEQLSDASDVFSTTISNVPPNTPIQVDITYLGELAHDAQTDGVRFTIPTRIAPRYGSYPGEMLSRPSNVSAEKGIEIVADIELPTGCAIKSIQSPTHPISVSIGCLSTTKSDATPSLQLASATLSLGSAELQADFVLQVVATDTAKPVAMLETHPSIPAQRALMATLVPNFNLPSSRPEVVFICDRSGSMRDGTKMPNVKSALHVFLKSLPLGVKFNICSFGTNHSFLFPEGSKSYDQSSLDAAMHYVDSFAADFGGTNIAAPVEDTFKRRYKDMDLEVFVLTDGEVWDQQRIFDMVNKNVQDSDGAIRLFTLGVGKDVSHALVQGLARAGNGFSQAVSENERMETKVVRMLKGALTPHVKDYSMEVKYGSAALEADDDDFELVEKVLDCMRLDVADPEDNSLSAKDVSGASKPTISLFDPNADDVDSQDPRDADRYSRLPSIPVPKMLQAPYQIPPLVPYSRTNVYLLLSPETAHRVPTAVILHGTSIHGPLELEIPVTRLTSPGETIHQLATRKATQELEEGRGWIFHESDMHGKLPKDKYEGRFSDMVEREAVRLGVQFQVAGKWCSFVAVEDHDKELGTEEAKVIDGSQTTKGPSRASLFHRLPPAPNPRRFWLAVAESASTRPQATAEMSVQSTGAFGSMMHGGRSQHALPHSSAAREIPGSMPIFAERMADTRSAVTPKKKRAIASTPGGSAALQEDSAVGQGHEDLSGDSALLENDPLQAIVALQTYSGYWPWSEQLLDLLKLDRNIVTKKLQGVVCGIGQDQIATALVISYLQKKLSSERDAWELLVDKATSWLESEIGDSAKVLIEAADGLFE